MYNALNNNELVILYIPYSLDGQLPEKEFFIKLIWSLFTEHMFDLINKAHKSRAANNIEVEDYLIEVDLKIAKKIEFVIQQPSMNFEVINFDI